MAGDATNTSLWDGADVYIAEAGTAAPTDTTTAWAAAWSPIGLLNGEEGFTEAREEETAEHYAWGGVLYRRTKSKHKRTIRFVALEDNETTFALRNPGSSRTTADGLVSSTVKLPVGHRFAIGFETRDAGKVKRRAIRAAEIQEIAEIKESEIEPTLFDVTVLIFPEADGTLYTEVADA
ncbi:phage tail tube protein [Cellulomonas sp. Marseille-Q8402]